MLWFPAPQFEHATLHPSGSRSAGLRRPDSSRATKRFCIRPRPPKPQQFATCDDLCVDSRFPKITPVEWLSAREVLGGEASDFTPWLQLPESMEALGRALKLEELTAISAEHNVLGKRLDILATAIDENGEEIPVCIENQYGTADADHLGRLIAYLAQQDRGRAVWVVEQAHDAYVAAVRFLNRTSSDEVGYYLVQVRFTHGPDGGHQVHFEVLAAPIAWERTGKARQIGASRAVNATKVDFINGILDVVRPGLLAAGFPSMNTHARGSYLWVNWHQDLWIRRFARRIDIKVTKSATRVPLYIWNLSTREANTAAMQILHNRYATRLANALPGGTTVSWFVGGAGRREVVRAELDDCGYETGDVRRAAEWAESVVCAWLDIVRSDPIDDLESQVEALLPGQGQVTDDEESNEEED